MQPNHSVYVDHSFFPSSSQAGSFIILTLDLALYIILLYVQGHYLFSIEYIVVFIKMNFQQNWHYQDGNM